ncbi:MAG TPA: NUDIX domain-containing protein [Thermoanaerobaculia bacterium]|jgi:predicted NUDIX family phosphoesterase
MSEQVMVVAREDLAPFLGERNLIRDDLDAILAVINERHFFIDRPTAEVSPQFKQIIPYVVIRHGEELFLLTRTAKQTEARLHHKRSLGIGGHINPDTPTLLGGLRKELEEEVFVGEHALTFVGILNDDSTEVGRVHLGAVYVLDAATRDVRVRETEKMSGAWISRDALAQQREAMESWSQIVYSELLS